MRSNSHIGRYEVRRVLATGATSRVFLAHDPELDVDVAVKLLADHLVHRAEVVEQFLAQARTLRSITDRRVIAVHDIGTTEAGQPYFVMDLATGGSLADRLKANEPLDDATRADLAIAVGNDLAEGLAAVHRHGVVHGDVKPENVFVADAPDGTVFPAGAHVVLGDLGGVDAAGGALPGTPGYMPPEQAAGEALDARADVYAATALVVRILTGRPPAPDGAAVLGPHRDRFGAFVTRGLAADPAGRPADVVAWATGLRGARSRLRRRTLVAVLAVVVLAGVVAALIGRNRGDDAAAVLVAGPAVVAVGGTSEGTAVTGEVSLGFAPAGAAQLAPDRYVIADADGNRVVQFEDGAALPLVGTGAAGDGGDGGPAADAQLNRPRAVAVANGTVIIADSANNRVRAVSPAGRIRTIAGSGAPGDRGDGGAATAAAVGGPIAVAALDDGRVLVVGAGSNRVRVFEPGGNIAAFAGSGRDGFGGDDGPAVDASLRDPRALAVGGGAVYIADTGNHRIRKVAGDGTITTLVDLEDRNPVALGYVDGDVITALDDGTVLRISPDGRIASVDPL